MKSIFRLIALFAFCSALRADTISYDWSSGFTGNGLIPDGNITGWSDTQTLAGLTGRIIDVDVRLDISGGFNGDYYAYLTHDSGISILLNRVGKNAGNVFGAFDSGLNITLDDSALLGDIHNYESAPDHATLINDGSSWIPDGRYIDPLTVLDSDSPDRLLSEFNTFDPNGAWTLFIADLSNGEVGGVESWGLTITTTAVPESGSFWPTLLAIFTSAMLFRQKVTEKDISLDLPR